MRRLLLGPLLRHVGPTDATLWVETDGPCEVNILGVCERTWDMAGHHYALIVVTGLPEGASTEYQVTLDGDLVWPPPDSTFPPSRIHTWAKDDAVEIAFGSCRYASAAAVLPDRRYDSDVLQGFSRRIAAEPAEYRPRALIMLGDQVYADETSPQTRQRIRERRDISTGSREQVADFEEYTWLYSESWSDPDVRWLLSTVPTSMIFDDHDVRDDWNTSAAWRRDMQRTTWWAERIIGALSSYWVYQHLGNLSPAELTDNDLFQRVRRSSGDVEPLLREFAAAADREADGAKGARWSYRRDLGSVRLLVIDTRCGRILENENRSMVGEDEFGWITDQLAGDYQHLLIGASLPWLLPRAFHDIEAWNELLCAGHRGRLIAAVSEKIRRAGDFEHWAAFRQSFERLALMIRDVARGDYAGDSGAAPATVCVLSGDVHHAYVATPNYAEPLISSVYQLTCSPLHNRVPPPMRLAFRVGWSRIAERSTRVILSAIAPPPRPVVEWTRTAGPYFGNDLMTLWLDGPKADLLLEQAGPSGERPELTEVTRLTLS